MNPEKTQGGRLVGAINCQADMAFEQMMDTKKQFGKTDKRQGYHIILSFKEDEVEPDRAFKITQKFVAEYLGDAYEAVFVVHDNTDHVHSHIVFNSVSFVDGKKYRYEKKEASKEKSKTYKAKERFKDIFDKAEQIRELDDAESCYQSGDTFFEDEHNAWERLNTELLAQGYSVEEVESLRKKYESKYAQDCKAERAVSKELSLGRSIWKELTVSASEEEKQYDKETIRDRREQPVR